MEVDIPDDVFMCNIDKTQFKRVYENLIGNTMDHNSPGKKIFVSINKIGNAVSILVCDNGKGINEEVLSKIFNPFVGTEKESEISGLGLYICKKFVEEHSGSIVYKSSKEYASIFEITLPIIR